MLAMSTHSISNPNGRDCMSKSDASVINNFCGLTMMIVNYRIIAIHVLLDELYRMVDIWSDFIEPL